MGRDGQKTSLHLHRPLKKAKIVNNGDNTSQPPAKAVLQRKAIGVSPMYISPLQMKAKDCETEYLRQRLSVSETQKQKLLACCCGGIVPTAADFAD